MCRPSMGAAMQLSLHGIEGGPVVLHDVAAGGGGKRVGAVVSHLSQFLTATQNISGGRWDLGVGGEVQSLPKGFEQQTLVYIGASGGGASAGEGVVETVHGWGALLRRAHGTNKTAVRALDPTLTQLSFWTDNSACV